MLACSSVARAQSPPAASPANAVQPAAYTASQDPHPATTTFLTNRPLQEATPPSSYTFEAVYLDLDGVTPRTETLFMLDDAARAMVANPSLNVNIEGHTCNIGPAEYNLALGDRRATAVKDYLLGRGVAASRLRTASYGEEDPDHANAHEDTRRLNRRVALVVRLKP